MGLFKDIGESAMRIADATLKQVAVRRGFEAGQKGEPPPVFVDNDLGRELQAASDAAYEKGQQSVLVKIGRKLAD